MATAEVIADARKILAASGTTVCASNGQGLPVMSEAEGIRLNDSKSAGQNYETFHLRGRRVRSTRA
jgi:hypothetical protein